MKHKNPLRYLSLSFSPPPLTPRPSTASCSSSAATLHSATNGPMLYMLLCDSIPADATIGVLPTASGEDRHVDERRGRENPAPVERTRRQRDSHHRGRRGSGR